MTMAADLFNQFQTYWRAGTDARLNLECHAGKVWMTLQIHLNQPPPTPPLHSQHQQQPRKSPSPSRLRRRAKRAEARAAGKAAGSKTTEDAAVQTDACPVNHPSVSSPVDEQHHHQAAVEAAQFAEGVHHVSDVFCPDGDYHDQHVIAQAVPPPPRQEFLPQLDGHTEQEHETEVCEQHGDDDEWINPHPITGLWICRCCHYAHSFAVEDDLRKHHDMLAIEYDECNICYPWHVWS